MKNKGGKRGWFHSALKQLCHLSLSVFLAGATHSLPAPSHSERGASSSLPPLVCWPLCLADLDLAFSPSLSLTLPLLSLWFSLSLSLSNPLNFSQSPLYASHYSSRPPPMSCLLFRPLVLSVSRPLTPHGSDRQPVKSGSYVNMTEPNANASKTAFSFELDKQMWHTHTPRAPCNPFTLPLLMHPAPSANHNALTWARVSPQRKNKHAPNTCVHKCFHLTLTGRMPCINFNHHSDISN